MVGILFTRLPGTAVRSPFSLTLVTTLAGLFWMVPVGGIHPAPAEEILLESTQPEGGNARVRRYGLTRDDYQRILQTLPRVQHLVPVRKMPQQARNGERITNIDLIGTTGELATLDELKVAHGRFLTTKDVTSRNNVAVIDTLTARRLFAFTNPIGQNVRIGDDYFLIVGRLAEDQGLTAGKRRTGKIYIPLTAMQSRFGDLVVTSKTGAVEMDRYELSQIRVELEPNADVSAAMRVIRELLKKTHETTDYSVRSTGSAFEKDRK